MHSFLLKYKMNLALRNFRKKFRHNPDLAIEYGDPRKTEVWGRYEHNRIIFLLELDTFSERPYAYRIEYDRRFKAFHVYTRMGNAASYTNVLQFTCSRFNVLLEKFYAMLEHVPVIRERLLRHYFYDANKQKKGSQSSQVYAMNLLQEFRSSGKISANEHKKIAEYISIVFPAK
ncbi:MAG: hypothetical protein KDK38_16150 [Leptospiraceae bacterium]|nr:hypothetical protein [Leptospiraceae bacterium]